MRGIGRKGLLFRVFMGGFMTIFWACATTPKEPAPVKASEEKALQAKVRGPAVKFYDFDDIPIPEELTLQKDKSFVYETPGLKAGVLIFSGNVEATSLLQFFKDTMVKNHWRLLNSFKYKGYMLNFIKDDRSCMISILDGTFSTTVEIWVGPIKKS